MATEADAGGAGIFSPDMLEMFDAIHADDERQRRWQEAHPHVTRLMDTFVMRKLVQLGDFMLGDSDA